MRKRESSRKVEIQKAKRRRREVVNLKRTYRRFHFRERTGELLYGTLRRSERSVHVHPGGGVKVGMLERNVVGHQVGVLLHVKMRGWGVR